MAANVNVTELVKRFNGLPKKARAPSGRFPNNWHFDVRYMHFTPPSHVVFIFQPESRCTHQEFLPILPQGSCELSDSKTTDAQYEASLGFFPESAEEAAPEVVKALLHFFVHASASKSKGGGTGSAPMKLTTECQHLLRTTNAELERLGVRSDCRVQRCLQGTTTLAQESYGDLFKTCLTQMQYPKNVVDTAATPTSILFWPPERPKNKRIDDSEADKINHYVRTLTGARPHKELDKEPSGPTELPMKFMQDKLNLENLLETKPTAVLKAAADAGDAVAALDYALRLQTALRCTPNRTEERKYFIKAILSPNAEIGLKATAHALLMPWYIVGDNRLRFVLTACHHADTAARLSNQICSSANAAPAVLHFLGFTIDDIRGQLPDFHLFKYAIQASAKWRKQSSIAHNHAETKRMKNPNRYKCAAVGCGIESTSGKVFSRCSGKCDTDKKPSYCGTECQKKDWKNHKPFCKAGAECSVIDPTFKTHSNTTKMDGAVKIGVDMPDGQNYTVSSSTIPPETLKEMRDHLAAQFAAKGLPAGMAQNMWFDVDRIDLPSP